MKTHTITKLITMSLAALVAANLLGGLRPVHAQTGDGSVRFISYASIGIVPGQKVRLTVGNPEEASESLSLSFSYYLAHGTNSASSVPLYESEWIKVPPREFRFSDVLREDLKTEGEPVTGRAQVLVKVNIIAPAGSNTEDFPVSLEIIEDGVQSGETVQTDSKYRLILVAARRSKPLVRMGFVPGEMLRYSFFYPQEEGDQPVRVTGFVYDSYGNLLHQTDPVVLRPGDFQAFAVHRDDLRVPGEERTGRLQVSAGIQVVLMDGSVRPVKLPVSLELVDHTGRTLGGSQGDYYTGTVSVSGDGF